MATKKKLKVSLGTSPNLSVKGSERLTPAASIPVNPKKSSSQLASVASALAGNSQSKQVRDALAGITPQSQLSTARPISTSVPNRGGSSSISVGTSPSLSVTGPGRATTNSRSSNFAGSSGSSFSSLAAPTINSRISSSSLSQSSSLAQGLPAAPSGSGYTGVLQGIQAGTKSNTYDDGSPVEYDPETGQPVRPKEVPEQEDFFSKMLKDQEDAFNDRPSQADLYQKAEKAAGVRDARQRVNDLSAQLNTITATAEAQKLSLIGQGRGIPEVIIGGQQAQIDREAAIRALPIAAQLSAAQGNLELAEDHLDTMFNLLSKDAEEEYNYRSDVRKMVYERATAQEKRRLDQLQTEDNRRYDEQKDLRKTQRDLLLSATTQGAPRAIINAIQSAQTPEEAIVAAGRYSGDVATSGSSSSGVSSSANLSSLARAVSENPSLLTTLTPTDRGRVLTELANNGVDLKQFTTQQLSSSQREQIDGFDTLLSEANNAMDALEGVNTGPIAGRFGAASAALGVNEPFAKYRSVIDNMNSFLLKLRSGAAVTPEEFARISGFIPQITDDEKAAKTKIERFTEETQRAQQNYVRRATQSTDQIISEFNGPDKSDADPLGLFN